MNPAVLMFVIALLSFGPGCKDTTQNPPDEPPVEEQTNPNTPNANELITLQRMMGDPDKKTSIWEIIDSGDGGFYYRGYYNNRYALGKLDLSGQEAWSFRSKYSVRDLIRIPDLSGGLSNSILSVGGFDSDFDGHYDLGYVSLVDRSGDLISELEFDNDAAAVWLSALAVSVSSDTLYHLVAVGGAEISGIYFPYVAQFTVANDSTISKTGEKIFTDLPAKNFRNIQFDLEQTPPVCYLQGDEYATATGYGDQSVYRMSDDLEIFWSQEIVAQEGFESWTANGRGFACTNNLLFLAGTTEIDKEENPTGGGYWDAGLIARLSTNGSVDWLKSIVLSQYSERFYSCCLGDGVLYVAGKSSALLKTETKNVFANALLLKVDPETGDVVSDHSFGSRYYRSQFNHVIVRGSQAFAVGYTNSEVDDGPYRGWFVIIDVSGTSIISEMSQPVMDHTRDGNTADIPENPEETGFRNMN